jgi:hypothetical protein
MELNDERVADNSGIIISVNESRIIAVETSIFTGLITRVKSCLI